MSRLLHTQLMCWWTQTATDRSVRCWFWGRPSRGRAVAGRQQQQGCCWSRLPREGKGSRWTSSMPGEGPKLTQRWATLLGLASSGGVAFFPRKKGSPKVPLS